MKKHKHRCEQQDFTSIKISNDNYIHWKIHYHKIPLYFRKYADFECNNEIDNSTTVEKTTNNNKQNPVCNGYYFVSDLPEVLASEYKYNFGSDNVDWLVNEIIKLENQKNFFSKNTNIETIMTEKDEYNFENSNNC